MSKALKHTGNVNLVWSGWLRRHEINYIRLACILSIGMETAKKYIKHPQHYFSISQLHILASWSHTPIMVLFALLNGISERQSVKWYQSIEMDVESILRDILTPPDKSTLEREPVKMARSYVNMPIYTKRWDNQMTKVNTPPPAL